MGEGLGERGEEGGNGEVWWFFEEETLLHVVEGDWAEVSWI